MMCCMTAGMCSHIRICGRQERREKNLSGRLGRAPPAAWMAGCGYRLSHRTHIGDDGDEGVSDGEGEALWRP